MNSEPVEPSPSPLGGSTSPTATADQLVSREIASEQEHVDRVYSALDLATASAKEVARQGHQLYQSDRTTFFREEDGTALFERDAFAFQSARRLAVLDAEHEGLVFGRLDLTEPDTRYIGRIGVRDDDYEPLVIDWRAPAAEPFYRATPNEPMGVIRRRVLRCRNDLVVGIEDDLLDADSDPGLAVVGEGALMAALKRSRGDAMRDIVATIQSEQDEAIRAPYQGVTVISGGPGTGKTVVALHRAAFLLYSHRRRLENGGVLVVGPSSVFMNYIERVLPSLGEDSVTLRAIGQVAKDVLALESSRVDEARAATIKGSLTMVAVLDTLVRTPLVAGHQFTVTVKGEVLTLTEPELTRVRAEVLRSRKVNNGAELAGKLAVNALWEKFHNEAELDRDQFVELVTSSASYAMGMLAWWPSLEARDVLLRLADRDLLDRVAPQLSSADRDALADSFSAVLDGEGFSVADMALLDELVATIGIAAVEEDDDRSITFEGGHDVAEVTLISDHLTDSREVDPDADPWDTFAHVLVDESQDITPMQWRMLRRRGPQASWTLVGDVAQSSYPHPDETAEALRTLIGRAPHREFRLSTNYRSPAEVFDLATKVITRIEPDADVPAAVRSTGVDPLLTEASDEGLEASLEAHLDQLRGQVAGTIGVIVPPSLHARLSAHFELRSHDEPIRVVTALQAKGLEYDAAVVVAPDSIVAEAPGAERVLYVALTRPTQRLVTVDLVPAAQAKWRLALGA